MQGTQSSGASRTSIEKVRKKTMNEPKRGEIRKAERLACKLTGKQDCRVTGYYTEGANGDFQTFQCEVLSDGGKMREIDIYVDAFLPDRRRSRVYTK
jgi:hypothetical protein